MSNVRPVSKATEAAVLAEFFSCQANDPPTGVFRRLDLPPPAPVVPLRKVAS